MIGQPPSFLGLRREEKTIPLRISFPNPYKTDHSFSPKICNLSDLQIMAVYHLRRDCTESALNATESKFSAAPAFGLYQNRRPGNCISSWAAIITCRRNLLLVTNRIRQKRMLNTSKTCKSCSIHVKPHTNKSSSNESLEQERLVSSAQHETGIFLLALAVYPLGQTIHGPLMSLVCSSN